MGCRSGRRARGLRGARAPAAHRERSVPRRAHRLRQRRRGVPAQPRLLGREGAQPARRLQLRDHRLQDRARPRSAGRSLQGRCHRPDGGQQGTRLVLRLQRRALHQRRGVEEAVRAPEHACHERLRTEPAAREIPGRAGAQGPDASPSTSSGSTRTSSTTSTGTPTATSRPSTWLPKACRPAGELALLEPSGRSWIPPCSARWST